MSLKQRVLKGDTIPIEPGKSLLESLWTELLKEWADPDIEYSPVTFGDDDSEGYAYNQGYCVGLAYAIAKIRSPYFPAGARIESVIEIARAKKKGIDYIGGEFGDG